MKILASTLRRLRSFIARRNTIRYAMDKFGWSRRRAELYVDALIEAHQLARGAK